MVYTVSPPFQQFTDTDGSPLENGYIWVGVANQDPQTNPVAVYWDSALTLPAAQPIRTLNGYPVNNGTPTNFYAASDYSIRVMNKSGSTIYSAPRSNSQFQFVSVKDFGAVGDGVVDDTAAIQTALNNYEHVIVPAGLTPLVSESITVPSHTRLQFMGGIGNLPSAMPSSYLIMKSTMTTPAILINECATVDGGGVLGQIGNTGDGVQLVGNSATLRNFIVCQAGRDGVRVGVDGTYHNSNSTTIEFVKAKNNGRYGFYVHDGVSVGPADANAGTLLQCEADANGADGIRLGHCFWVSVINCLTETNTGWGLYLSGIDNGTYPECRWASIIGGDFNEGNTAGTVYDSSYFSTFINPDNTQFPSNTTTTGLQGAGVRSQFGGTTRTSFYGGTFYTGSGNQYPVSVDGGSSGSTDNNLSIKKKTTATNGNGTGLGFSISSGGVNPYVQAGEIQVTQNTTDQYGMTFNVYRAGALPAVEINANAYTFRPRTDNTWSLGTAGLRWTTVYAVTGTINTSDMREKQQVRQLSDVEKAVAVRLKELVRMFKWNDSVEKKGDDARVHIGIMAQDVKTAFESEGLDAHKYAVLCYNEWDDEYEDEYETKLVKDQGGNDVETRVPTGNKVLVREAGNLYGVRYDQLLTFIISAM